MNQFELTSKLVLAVMITLSSISALIIVPTAHATPSAPNIPENNTMTSSSSSVDNGNGNGQVLSQEDIRNLVGGAISGAIQLKVEAISSPLRVIQPNSGASFDVQCPQGMFATGGGFSTNGDSLDVALFQPDLSNGNEIQSGDTPDEWHTLLSNPHEAPVPANSWVVCVGLGQ
jgi:hypothetical protein